jgi:hypothetical protein
MRAWQTRSSCCQFCQRARKRDSRRSKRCFLPRSVRIIKLFPYPVCLSTALAPVWTGYCFFGIIHVRCMMYIHTYMYIHTHTYICIYMYTYVYKTTCQVANSFGNKVRLDGEIPPHLYKVSVVCVCVCVRAN